MQCQAGYPHHINYENVYQALSINSPLRTSVLVSAVALNAAVREGDRLHNAYGATGSGNSDTWRQLIPVIGIEGRRSLHNSQHMTMKNKYTSWIIQMVHAAFSAGSKFVSF